MALAQLYAQHMHTVGNSLPGKIDAEKVHERIEPRTLQNLGKHSLHSTRSVIGAIMQLVQVISAVNANPFCCRAAAAARHAQHHQQSIATLLLGVEY